MNAEQLEKWIDETSRLPIERNLYGEQYDSDRVVGVADLRALFEGKVLVPVDEITPAMWSAGRNEFLRICDRVKYAMHSEIESAEIDAAPQSMMNAMLAASQEQGQ